MVKMKTADIEDKGNIIIVNIPDSKTRKVRTFTVIGENNLNIYRRYTALRPNGYIENRFFLKYQSGKCYRAVMGIHSIGSVPRKVATFLQLNNPNEYTGHSMRRTSATLLIDGGANIESLKRHGGWKSSSVAEGYIEDSLRNKNEIAGRILSVNEFPGSSNSDYSTEASAFEHNPRQNPTSSLLHGFNFQNATLTNCIFNVTLTNKNDV